MLVAKGMDLMWNLSEGCQYPLTPYKKFVRWLPLGYPVIKAADGYLQYNLRNICKTVAPLTYNKGQFFSSNL
jgi:hypothetical protein